MRKNTFLTMITVLLFAAFLASCKTDTHTHSFKMVNEVDATCTNTGVKAHNICEGCSEIFDLEKNVVSMEQLVTEKLGHLPTKIEAVDATCEKNGNSSYYECLRCHEYFSDSNCEKKIEEYSWIIPSSHKLEHHAAVSKTCTENGNVEYYECSECGKYFTDAEGKNEIVDIVVLASHELEHHAAVSETCTTSGNSAYYQCSECGKYFSDANGNTEIAENSWIISPHAHSLEFHAAVSKTCTVNGNIEYYECMECHKHFTDAEGKNEIENVVVLASHELEHHAVVSKTCTENGNIEYYECMECHNHFTDAEGKNEIENVVVLASHELEFHAAVSKTCTENGNVEYYECSECGKYFTDADGKNEIVDIVVLASHELEHHAAVSETCTTSGNSAYYQCSECGKYFSDENGNTEIAENSWIISPHAHSLDFHAAVSETCTTSGNSAYYQCSECHKYFSDENGNTEIAENSWIILPHAHSLEFHAAVSKTCIANGNIEYYECSECHKHFTDADGKNEIENVVVLASHELEFHAAVSKTCTEDGNVEYYQCIECGKCFTDTDGKNEIVDIVVLASHDWPTPTYAWSSDYSECTATRVCKSDSSHVETETVSTVYDEIVDGNDYVYRYTATFTNPAFDGKLDLLTFTIDSKTDTYYVRTSYHGIHGSVEIPSMVNGKAVTAIEDRAFIERRGLESIKIPSSVKKIGEKTFMECTSLKTVIYDENSQLTTICNEAFSDCTSLESIFIPKNVISLGESSFYMCENAASIIFEAGIQLTGLPWDVFCYCESVSTIEIPKTITNFGDDVFFKMTSLNTINYAGTIAEWEKISKGEDWNFGVPASKIHCTDGDVDNVYIPVDDEFDD